MPQINTPCPLCNGRGQIQTPDLHAWQPCWKCDGTGEDPGIERFFTYPFQGTLTALQVQANQRVVINGDAPFRIKLLTRVATGPFRIRLFDSVNHYYSSSGEGGTNDRVRDTCLFGDGTLPFILVPHIVIPAGGYIGFDLEDVSNANNTIHLAFHGAKVYPSS